MNFRTLDLNLLRVFDVVMTERNVTRAADHLAMTQPAVSNALRRLREATHEDLFIPSSTGVTPTRQAEALWPSVRTALGSLRAAFEPQAFDPEQNGRAFTLAMADATAAVAVPALMRALDAEQAKVKLRFIPLATRDPRALLEHGEADLALGFFPGLAALIAAEEGSMQIERLWGCEYVCVMRHDHSLALQKTLSLDDYCAARHLRVSFAGRPRGFVDDALAALGREREVTITMNQFHSAACVVRQSDLLTVLPRSFVPATGFEADLAWRPLPLEVPGIDVSMVWHRRHAQDAGQRWLRNTLTATAAALPQRPDQAGRERPTVQPGFRAPAKAKPANALRPTADALS